MQRLRLQLPARSYELEGEEEGKEMGMGMDTDKLRRGIIADTISRDRVGRTLTPEAQQRATEFAAGQMGNGLNWGQLSKIGIAHVTEGILKEKP